MTYEQFENRLQDWLDEGRLDEADRLLDAVCPVDQPRCAELLATYRALFASLPEALHSAPSPSLSPRTISPVDRRMPTPLAPWGIALAGCLAALVLLPGLRNDGSTESSRSTPSVLVASSSSGDGPLEVATIAELTPQNHHFTRLATSSFEPLARNVVTRTDDAFKSLGQFAGTLNPIDDQLTAYREAAPLIGTLTRGFLPGTHSLGNAFSVLQESASHSTPVSTADAASEASTETTTPARTIG